MFAAPSPVKIPESWPPVRCTLNHYREIWCGTNQAEEKERSGKENRRQVYPQSEADTPFVGA
jgi:hypothetical protein